MEPKRERLSTRTLPCDSEKREESKVLGNVWERNQRGKV